MTKETLRAALLTGAVVAVNAVLGYRFIQASAPTYDEPVHLAAGYVALTTTLAPLHDRDHGPAVELWDALPLLVLRPALLWGDPSWGRLYHYGNAFLYRNRVDAEKLLNSARLWSLVSWTTVLAMALILWSLRLGGWPAAAAAAVLAAFCPLWLSNAALVTTDAGSSALFFLVFWILSNPRRTTSRWLAAGTATGLAIAAKYNMAVIPPLAAAAWLTDRRLSGQKNAAWSGPLVMAATTAAVLLACFLGRWDFFLHALTATMTALGDGRSAFLWGRYSTTGWAWYFPFALAVKSPLPFLIAAAAGMAFMPRLIPTRERVWLLLAPAFYFAAACHSNTQIGVRHILPVLPFLIVLGACAAGRAWRASLAGKLCVAALGAWLAAGVALRGPDYLAYFNEAAGGPDNGWRLLADSNIDWGQGLKELGAELRRRGKPPVFLSYFGAADPAYYGIRYVPVGLVTNVELGGPDGGPPALGPADPVLLAVSQTNLQGVYYQAHETFDWLKARRPAFVAGHSIFLYDLTKDGDGRRRLAAVLAAAGAGRWAPLVSSAR